MGNALHIAVLGHSGTFECVEIRAKKNRKTVSFRHLAAEPDTNASIPDIPGLAAFYSAFGNLRLYFDEESGDSAYYIGSPAEWEEFRSALDSWLDGMPTDDTEDGIPSLVRDCVVVGEVPRSGNYLLVATTGTETGSVYLFDHDGFEFPRLANSLPEFVIKRLTPSPTELTVMASYMRFTKDYRDRQWWIEEMCDNQGRVVRTMA
ncbi:MAG: hypothetical protein U1F26_06355 [Lysobacterales bacterium]